MNEEIRTLEKVIEELRHRVRNTARETFELNGHRVRINFPWVDNPFVEIFVDGKIIGGISVSEDSVQVLADMIALLVYRIQRGQI